MTTESAVRKRPSVPLLIVVGAIVAIALVVCTRTASSPNRPIVFYGRVVDEQNNGVGGVEVSGEVWGEDPLHVPMPWTSASRRQEFGVTTDRSGNFTLNGLRGTSLFVKQIAKPGYIADLRGQFGFGYVSSPGTAVHRPNPDQPVLFKVARKKSSGGN